MLEFGDLLKQAMKEKNMTQRELAKQIHVSPQTICAFVNNQRTPNLDCFFKIIDILDLYEYFFLKNPKFAVDYTDWIMKHVHLLSNEQKQKYALILYLTIQPMIK